MKNICEILSGYRQAAAGAREKEPNKHNEWHMKCHTHYKCLRQTEAGKRGIAALLDDDDPYVRCRAAAHCLQWAPDVARPVLEKLRDDNTVEWQCAFDAEMVLQEYDKGRLSFDY